MGEGDGASHIQDLRPALSRHIMWATYVVSNLLVATFQKVKEKQLKFNVVIYLY